MKKFIPYEKMSKRMKKEADKQKRKDWGVLSPVTRKSKNAKIYDRKKIRSMDRNDHGTDFYFFADD